MYLKQLEIQGFKSFASKTVFSFLPPVDGHFSVTAIIGPNGSGKSNVSDAIRWVMGEQSMKTLRGKKSEDIIFAGSEHKGQLGFASVMMHLDNTDGRIPIVYEEVIIGRRLYRTGESDYLLNGNSVRLLDLQLLLAKAQFGHGSYSVVGQGMIDRMLLQSPQERKNFFDEAVGIKEFQIKRHQAMLKLNRSREHIVQAELLLNEMTPRLRSLSRQVKKLEQRQGVEVALREMQEQYYATLSIHHQRELQTIQTRLAQTNLVATDLSEKLNIIQSELAGIAQEASRSVQFASLQSEYQEVLRAKNGLERDRAVLQGKLQTEYSKAGKQNVAWLETKIDDLRKQLIELNTDVEESEAEMNRLSERILRAKKETENLYIRRTELRGLLANAQQRAVDSVHQQTIWQHTGLCAVQAILEQRDHFGTVYGLVAELGTVDAQYQMALDVSAGSHLTSLVVKDETVGGACIEYLRKERLGIATFLPLNKIQARYLPHDIDLLKQESGVHGLAIDLVRFDARFADIFSYVLGSTLIVEDMEVARRIGIGKIRMVTLDGDVFETSGSIKGGFRKQRAMGASFGDHGSVFQATDGGDARAQAERLQKELEETDIAYEHAQDVMRQLESSIQIATGKSHMVGLRKQEIERELAQFEQEQKLTTMSKDEYTTAMTDVEHEKSNVDGQLTAIEKTLQGIQHKIDRFNQEEEAKKERVFALQDEMQTVQKELNMVVDARNVDHIEIARIETKQEDLEQEAFQELSESAEKIAERVSAVLDVQTLEQTQTEIQKLKYQLSLIGGIDDDVLVEHDETKLRHDELTAQLDDLSKTITDLETLIGELDQIMKKKRDKAFKQIKKEFGRYFKILFDGGEADLVEVYGYGDEEIEEMNEEDVTSDPILDKDEEEKKKRRKKMLIGIDVKAQPPGKKIKYLQTLSGGERTMTSIALVCAILHTNPSPFVVLDEVEAALDEANSERFTNILTELAIQSQFILITHNRVTMHVADALYGVTMGNEGVSKVVSVDLTKN